MTVEKKRHPMVSVIIPGYNHAPYLRERIDSVLAQDYMDFEVIMLDDCSSDKSREIMQDYADAFNQGRLNTKARGISFHPNDRNTGNTFLQWEKGIELAKGEYIWIAESDDVAEPQFLSKLMNKMQQTPGAVLAFSMSLMIDSEGKELDYSWDEPRRYKAPGVYDGPTFCRRRLVQKNLLYNASMIVFAKSCYQNVPKDYQLFRNAGDWLFWYYVCKQGKVCEVPEKLNRFRQHTQKVSTKARNTGEDFKEMAAVQSVIVGNLSLGAWTRSSLRGRQTKRIRKATPHNMKELVSRYPQIYGGTFLDKIIYVIDKIFNFSNIQS